MRGRSGRMSGDLGKRIAPCASYHIRKIAGACAVNAGNVFPAVAGKRSRHTSRHVRDGIANEQCPLKSAAAENVPGIPGACVTCNFTYLVRGPCEQDQYLWR